MSDLRAEIERRLTDAFEPETLEIVDDSAKHVGHPGVTSGGGHFRCAIVSATFAGMDRIARHRAVYAALGDLVGGRIHALALSVRAPGE